MTLQELMSDQPRFLAIPGARVEIRRQLETSGRRLAVMDDDPTGTQTVHDVDVYMEWTEAVLRQAIASGDPVFYLSTNSRALAPPAAVDLARELGANLRRAAASAGIGVNAISRSDSTLRGHFPAEVDAVQEGLGERPDGVLIAPAFFEAGRYTIGDVHYVEQNGQLVPAAETEFARDPDFGYGHSDLKEWVEEKTGGFYRAAQVLSLPLSLIRAEGPAGVARVLECAEDGVPVVVNAACYEDLEVVVLGLLEAESAGKRFACRCAAPFVKVRGGMCDRPLLASDELGVGRGPGLIIAGSYVEKTTRQLEKLLSSGRAAGVELRITELSGAGRDAEIWRVAAEAETLMLRGVTPADYTSRDRLQTGHEEFLAQGAAIMDAICLVVGRINLRPSYLVAKGGITSLELARTAMGVKRARVLGQIIPGVPVWHPAAGTRWAEIPYVVYPGNVGDDNALLVVVEKLDKAKGFRTGERGGPGVR